MIEKIVLYLYSGELNGDDLPLKSLLDVLELFQLIDLPGKYSEVEAFITKNKEKITKIKSNRDSKIFLMTGENSYFQSY